MIEYLCWNDMLDPLRNVYWITIQNWGHFPHWILFYLLQPSASVSSSVRSKILWVQTRDCIFSLGPSSMWPKALRVQSQDSIFFNCFWLILFCQTEYTFGPIERESEASSGLVFWAFFLETLNACCIDLHTHLITSLQKQLELRKYILLLTFQDWS